MKKGFKGRAILVFGVSCCLLFAEYLHAQSADQKTFHALSDEFARAAQKIAPSVVSVSTMSEVTVLDPYEFFFGPRFRKRDNTQRQQVPRGIGSGILVNGEYVLTNNHVIEGADTISIKLNDGRTLTSKVVGADKSFDVAVLKVTGGDHLVPAELGDSDALRVGEWVLAVGNPFGLDQTVTAGIISATGRAGLGLSDYGDFIQTDAAINPGNSGGPLVNLDGKVIAINSAILSATGGFEGIGFAIPINTARTIMDSLIKTGKVVRGYLGVQIQELTPEMADTLGIHDVRGLLISHVDPNSPAQAGGLKARDVVTHFNGSKIDSARRFSSLIKTVAPDQDVELTIVREGKEQKLKIKIGAMPESIAMVENLGFDVSNVDEAAARKFGLPKGMEGVVVTSIDSKSLANRAGLQEGDVIVGMERRKISNMSDYSQALEKASGKDKILLQIVRGDEHFYMVIPLK